MILIKALSTKAYHRRASGDCGTSGKLCCTGILTKLERKQVCPFQSSNVLSQGIHMPNMNALVLHNGIRHV